MRLRFLLACFALLLVAAGCSASADDSPEAASPAAADPREDWAQCMREHKVPIQETDIDREPPNAAELGVDQATVDAAMEACKDLAQAAVGQQDDTDKLDAFRAHAQCMRDHGVKDFPDPQIDATGDITFGPGIRREDPRFREAQEACAKESPGHNGGGFNGGNTGAPA